MLEKFLEREKTFYEKRSNVDPISIFHKKVAESVKLVTFVERKSKISSVKLNARKNYVINLVTAAEVYFKDLVKILPEFQEVKRDLSGLRRLLDEKITIWDAFQLFKNKKVGKSIKIGNIISVSFSFQNLEQIDFVFSQILLIKFLDKVEEHKRRLNEIEQDFFKVKTLCLKSNLPQWRRTIADLFNARHDIVHEVCFVDKLSYKQISRFWCNIVCFIYAVDYFIRDTYL